MILHPRGFHPLHRYGMGLEFFTDTLSSESCNETICVRSPPNRHQSYPCEKQPAAQLLNTMNDDSKCSYLSHIIVWITVCENNSHYGAAFAQRTHC